MPRRRAQRAGFSLRPDDYDIVDLGYETPCWIWRWAKTPRGYGKVQIAGRLTYVHRWQLRDQLSESRPYALHRCHNPSCINSAHLYAGTQAENMADMVIADRAYRGNPGLPPGENHPNAILTQAQVDAIRSAMIRDGDGYRYAYRGQGADFAREYGVCRSTITLIKNRSRWT